MSTDLRLQLESALGSSYIIERELGGGGMSRVFLAEETRFGRKVVIKVLTEELAQGLSADRFEREIKLAAQLQQANIVPVLGAGEIPATKGSEHANVALPYYTMPFVEGESLRARLVRGTLPLSGSIAILRDVARALAYAHSHGVVHRDIKPENVLLSGGAAVVTDFGIAKALSASKTQAPGGTLTVVGTSLGTPAYMAPEQAVGDHVDERADLYAWGVMAYELLAGAHPFSGRMTAQQLIAAHIAEQPRELRDLHPSVPPALATLVMRCVEKDPNNRPQSATEVLHVMEDPALAGGTTSSDAPALSATHSRANRGAATGTRNMIIGAVIAVILIGALVVERGRISALFHGSGPAALAFGESSADSAGIKMAVLPFENLGDSADAYFADGITDAVRGKLTSMHNLEVIARSSSEEYRATRKSARQIASELGVRYLLTGTVRWAKQADGTSRVQVSPELVELADGTARSRWQQPFDAPLTDVFKVQSDIAGKVAQALDVALGTSDREQLAERPTQDLVAYDDYLKGTAIQGSDPVTLKRAAAFFERAVARDSTFGLAWAGLAYVRGVQYMPGQKLGSNASIESALAKARRYAPRAVETYRARVVYLDATRTNYEEAVKAVTQEGLAQYPDSPDLLRILGIIQTNDMHMEQGTATLRRALELDPRSLITIRVLASNLAAMHQVSESLALYRRALTIAPGDIASLSGAMIDLAQMGDLRGARAIITNADPALDRTRLFAYTAMFQDLYWLLTRQQQDSLLAAPPSVFDVDGNQAGRALAYAEIYHERGDLTRTRLLADTARMLFEARMKTQPTDVQAPALAGLASALAGHFPEAVASASRAIAIAKTPPDDVYRTYDQELLARIYILAGDQDKALDVIEPLLSQSSTLSPGWLRLDPIYAPLKGNPRFDRLAKAGS